MRLRNDDSTEFYNKFYGGGGWTYKVSVERKALQRHVVAPAQWKPGQRLLEIGCGMGLHAKILSDLGFRVTALDASHSGIMQARRTHGTSEKLQYAAADLSRWSPDEDDVFDGIYSRGMSYFHYELSGTNCKGIDVPAQTARLFSWLREGGTFVLQICTDFSGDRPPGTVHSNRYQDYLDLFQRFGEVISVTDLDGRPVDAKTRGNPNLSPTKQGIIIVTRKASPAP